MEEDGAEHQSRKGKQKETKLQGIKEKRQCTAVVGSAADGSVPPAQLIIQGVASSKAALPVISGSQYRRGEGAHPLATLLASHYIQRLAHRHYKPQKGYCEAVGSPFLPNSKSLGKYIPTSYAILEHVIVPWLLKKKRALQLPADHPLHIHPRLLVRVERPRQEERARELPFVRSKVLPLVEIALCTCSLHRSSPACGPRAGSLFKGFDATVLVHAQDCQAGHN